MALLFRDTLRKDVLVYVEYSNEAWNSAFNSGIYCEMMGKKLGLSQDPLTARNFYFSKRSSEIIKIWKTIFGSEESRIGLILSSFMVMPIASTNILSYQNAYKSHSNIILAVTGYISCGDPTALSVAVNDLSVTLKGCDTDLPNVEK